MKNRKYIEEFVSSLTTIDFVKENLKSVKEHIDLYVNDIDVYKSLYSRSDYTLEELKYFKKLLSLKLKELRLKEKEELESRRNMFICYY